MLNLEIEKKIKEILSSSGPQATWVLAHKLGLKGQTTRVREIMISMGQRGLVRRHRDTARNNIIWQLVV